MQSSSLIVATAGHVDHGKTSLVNNITGTDTDTLAEEKARGLTINLGFAYHQFEESLNGQPCLCTLGFVDVPGHIDFISNMLAGVGSVDFALLVIAADDGIMPQTMEHLSILNLLGISQGAIALTKTDRVETERIDSLQTEIRELLANTLLANSPVFSVSNHTREGIEELVAHLRSALVNKINEPKAYDRHGFRFLVDRAFSVKGIGTVITGSARSGNATKDTRVVCARNGGPARIRALRLHEDQIDSIYAGQRAALNIDMDLDAISRGDWLLTPNSYRSVTRFDGTIKLLDNNLQLNLNTEYHLYIGASHHIVHLRYLDEKKTFIQVKSHDPITAHFGDRFILRDPAAKSTIGGGQVVDIFVPRKKRSSENRMKILNAMCSNDKQALQSLSVISPEGVNLTQYAINRNLLPGYIEKLLHELEQSKSFTGIEIRISETNFLLDKKFFDEYRKQVVDSILEFHKNNPSQQGISEPALSRSLNFSGSHFLFNALLQSLINDKSVKRTGTLLHLPEHRATLSKEEQEFIAKIRPILLKAGNIPPRTRELAEMTGIPLKPLERILRETTKAGSLIRVADNRHFLPETVMALAELTESLAADNEASAGFSVIQFRDTTGIGRNLCIEILEYFDRVGFTRRDGNARFLRTEKENIFGI